LASDLHSSCNFDVGGFAWVGLKALVDVWVRTRFVRFVAKLFIVLILVLMFNIAMQITYPV